MKKHLAVTALSSLLAISAHGAISITQNLTGTDYGTTTSVSRAFDVINTNAVLVVGVYNEDATTTGTISSPTFGGVAADGVIFDLRATLFYFLNPTTASGQTINYNNVANANGGGLAAWELAGVDLAATVASSTTDSITTLAANSFIVSFASLNGNATLAPATGSVIDTPLDIPSFTSPRSSTYALAGGSSEAATIGAYNVGWNSDGNGSPVAFAFQAAVPEPSSALLASLGLLALLRRRR